MKAERLMQLELLLLSHPEGMRRADIARRLGVHRSTVGRYIDELKKQSDICEDGYIIKLSPSEDTDTMKLSVYESLAFNLSAELLADHVEFQNPHLASGLRKIAGNMRTYAPTMSESLHAAAEAIELGSRQSDSQFMKILEVLTDSWVSGKIVRLKHRQGQDGETEETEFAPYFIGFREEENGRRPITVTGRLRHTSEICTIDIKNISSVEILDEVYTIPDNLRPFRKPDDARRYTGMDLIPLKLRLRERSALNSLSMVYRENLKVFHDANGELYCTMDAENSIELMLRIMQSGSSIEVIEPHSYRKKFVREVEKILEIYQK